MSKNTLAIGIVAISLAIPSTFVSASWDVDTALDAAYWCKIAYCHEDLINDNWSCRACPKFPGVTRAKGFMDDAVNQSFGYVAYYPVKDQIIYAFRGTMNDWGWVEDLDFFQVKYPNGDCTNDCKVHGGLYWGYNSLRVGLWDHLQALVDEHPNATLLVTGHSMGAAQSGYAFLDTVLHLKGHLGKKHLYNFGCPRLGNQAFVTFLEDTVEPHGEHFRHTNYGDPVPHLPPLIFDSFGKLLGDWLHTPREVFEKSAFYNPKKHAPKICHGNTTMEDPTCADSTPWEIMSFKYHETYLGLGMGCYLH